MARRKDINWNLPEASKIDGTTSWEAIHAAVLMDIRDELKNLNRIFGCYNFTEMPRIVRAIRTNTGRIPKEKK